MAALGFTELAGHDWIGYYHPATQALMARQSPYAVHGFYNAPWLLALLSPFALFPARVGFVLLSAVSGFLLAFYGLKHGYKPVILSALLVSFPVLYVVFSGQVDILLSTLSLLSPAWLGLLLLSAKPQLGIGLFVYHAYRIAKERQWLSFVPLGAMAVLSIALYGAWFLAMLDKPGAVWNYSLGLGGALVGVVGIKNALQAQSKTLSLAISPFCAPYVSPGSWHVALLALPGKWLVLVSLLSWVGVLWF